MIRELAIELLDDPHGVSLEAWKILYDMLEEAGHSDVIGATRGCEGRVFIDDAGREELEQR